MTTELIRESAASLQPYFEGEINTESRDMLQQWLTEQIVGLLVHDLEKLLNILYRVDVNEQKVKAAFLLHDPKMIAPQIAILLLERARQKAETRIRYRNGRE